MRRYRPSGTVAAIVSFFLWGILPLYWGALKSVAPLEILAHRVVFAVLFLLLIVHFRKGWREVYKIISNRRHMYLLTCSTLLVGYNWYLYVWAVNSHHIMQASLGYYINPLMNIFLGVYFFKEVLTKRQWGALALTLFGILYLTISSGHFPLVAFVMALSFCLYGTIHKKIGGDAIGTLFIETAILGVPALIYLCTREGGGAIVTGSATVKLFLIFAGVVTATPLLLFVFAMNKVKLATLGFLQYISPTGQFVCGLLFFGEKLTLSWSITFLCIWSAVILYLFGDLKKRQLLKNKELRT